MSYNIDLVFDPPNCPTCGRLFHVGRNLPGPTYNLSNLFDLALTGESWPNPEVTEGQAVLFGTPTVRPRGLRVLSGKRTGETLASIELALARLHDLSRTAEFVALEPDNKWGTLPDAISVLEQLLEATRENPGATWRIQ